jgi:SPP1 family phage portal protein
MAEFESEGSDNSGLSKLTIDIPVDARKELLQETFDNIFIQGQGVNPKDLKAGTNMTGVAMKMLYGPLELKVGQMESEFRPSINKLVRFILDELHKPSDLSIKQTWIRSGIQNDVEQADIISKLSQVTSDEAIAKNNPLVSDWQDELSDRKREKEERAQTPDPFASPDPLGKDDKDDEDGDEDGKEA